MPYRYESQERKADVLSGISSCHHGPSSLVGCCLLIGSLLFALLLQLLVSVTIAADCAFLGIAELPRTVASQRLFADAVSLDVDRGPRDDLLPIAGISAGLLF